MIQMASLSTKSKWNIKITHASPCLYCGWDLPYGNDCAICRKSIMELSAKATDRSVCAPVIGKCRHVFHKDCIIGWISNGNRKCPICKKRWEVKQINELSQQEQKNEDFLNNFNKLLQGIPDYIREELQKILKDMKENENSQEKLIMIEKMIQDMISVRNNSENVEESINNSDDDMPELESDNGNVEELN